MLILRSWVPRFWETECRTQSFCDLGDTEVRCEVLHNGSQYPLEGSLETYLCPSLSLWNQNSSLGPGICVIIMHPDLGIKSNKVFSDQLSCLLAV